MPDCQTEKICDAFDGLACSPKSIELFGVIIENPRMGNTIWEILI